MGGREEGQRRMVGEGWKERGAWRQAAAGGGRKGGEGGGGEDGEDGT